MSDLGPIHKDVDPEAAMMGYSTAIVEHSKHTRAVRPLWVDWVTETRLDMASTIAARGHDLGLQQQLCAKNIRRGRRGRPYVYQRSP